MNPIPAQANVRTQDLVLKSTGGPIVAGTVNYYLIALTGANAGKWFKNSDNSWNAAETVCGTMTFKADGHWSISVNATAWVQNVEYVEYARENGDLHIPVSNQARASLAVALDTTVAKPAHITAAHAATDALIGGIGGAIGPGADRCTLTIQDEDGTPIADADVWISTDAAQTDIVAGTLQSKDDGTRLFMLDAGLTYYCWRQKAGVNFNNPHKFIAVADI